MNMIDFLCNYSIKICVLVNELWSQQQPCNICCGCHTEAWVRTQSGQTTSYYWHHPWHFFINSHQLCYSPNGYIASEFYLKFLHAAGDLLCIVFVTVDKERPLKLGTFGPPPPRPLFSQNTLINNIGK